MKLKGRGARWKEDSQKMAVRSEPSDGVMKSFPWKNPLKGGVKDIAMAEVGVKSAGVFVGFKVKF